MASLYRRKIYKTEIVEQIDPKTGKPKKVTRNVKGPDGKPIVVGKSKVWWGRWRDAKGRDQRKALSADKSAAQTMLAKIIKKADREATGLADPFEEHLARPLVEHLADYRSYLTALDRDPDHVKLTDSRVQAIIDSAQAVFFADLSPSRVVEHLGKLRRDGFSISTANGHLRAVKSFFNWMKRDRRIAENPIAHLAGQNADLDPRHKRRPLEPDEFARLIAAAESSNRTVESISGPDRAMLFVLATWTGYRRGELGSLTLQSFDLNAEPPLVSVAAAYSKRRQHDSIPLHPAVVTLLKAWLAGKGSIRSDELLFPVARRKTAKMMRADLAAARQAWIREAKSDAERCAPLSPLARKRVADEMRRRRRSSFLAYQDANGLFADFHSNRAAFITRLSQAGVGPRLAQQLARHSDIRLTMTTYTRLSALDLQAGIEALPSPPGANPERETAAALATGTHGRRFPEPIGVANVPECANNCAITAASEGSRLAPDGTSEATESAAVAGLGAAKNPLIPRGFSIALPLVAPDCTGGVEGVANGTRTRDPQIHNLVL